MALRNYSLLTCRCYWRPLLKPLEEEILFEWSSVAAESYCWVCLLEDLWTLSSGVGKLLFSLIGIVWKLLWVTLRELEVLPPHLIFLVEDLRLSTAADAKLIRLLICMIGAPSACGTSDRFVTLCCWLVPLLSRKPLESPRLSLLLFISSLRLRKLGNLWTLWADYACGYVPPTPAATVALLKLFFRNLERGVTSGEPAL